MPPEQTAMTPRESFRRVVRFQPADYVLNFEFGPMNRRMLDQWRVEGMPEDVEFNEYFGIHPIEEYIHIRYDPIPGVPDQGVIAEDEKWVVKRDSWGREVQRPKGEDMAEGARHIRRPGITCRADWERIRDQFRADEPLRYPDHWDTNTWQEMVARWRDRTHPVILRGPSMVGDVKEVMGFENFCIMLHEDRALVEEIMETRTELALGILGRAFDEVDFDALHFMEDIAFNSGPILSPAMFEELAVPRYRRLADFYRSMGGEIVSVDSDGDVSELIPGWLEGGINHIWPLEVHAGMDVVALRRRYGHAFSMRGGVDKFALLRGKDAIDRELERVAPVVQDGGYIPHLDHQIPAGVTFESFCYYMERKKELLGLA